MVMDARQYRYPRKKFKDRGRQIMSDARPWFFGPVKRERSFAETD